MYTAYCDSPLGRIRLESDGEALTGLYFVDGETTAHTEDALPVFEETKRWLAVYFSGKKPDFTPPYRLIGTPFQRSVWELLEQIPYGETVSYGALARMLADQRGIARMSAQAVGGAVGRNPVSLIVPCHRVIGADGGMVGYGFGVGRKKALLALEHGK